jgi:hypothetical protein
MIVRPCHGCRSNLPPSELKRGLCPACSAAKNARRNAERNAAIKAGLEPQRKVWDTARWRKTRATRIEMDGRACRGCGRTDRLTVHHIVPVREWQSDSFYDLGNLVTLCLRCHAKAEAKLRAKRRQANAPQRRVWFT